MIRIRQVKVPIIDDNDMCIKKKISNKLNIDNSFINNYKIIKKSIDARKKKIYFVYEVDCNVLDEDKVISNMN